MGLTLTSGPASEPVTLAEAKLHCRVDYSDDDALITALIVALRSRAEALTGRALITQSWKLTADAFPVGALWLPKPKLVSVESVKYLDVNGAQQTWVNTAYDVQTSEVLGSVAPKWGTNWPDIRSQVAAVEVNYTAGYGNAVAVPQAVKSWILCYIAAAYDNRSAVAVGQRDAAVVTLPYVDALLDDYLVRQIV
jgi:uncharacterized phiE125 gp8 family phage protein